jgi:LacI family transcriptional regulator
LRTLLNHGYPFVVVEPRTALGDGIPCVTATHSAGATAATEHLLELGHRRIGAILGPPEGLATTERLKGFHAALRAAGIAPDPSLEVPSNFKYDGGEQAAGALLDRPDRPTAIFAFNDEVAVGAMVAARARGLRIPEDLSVVGFDDTLQARLSVPPLTTVRQPLAEIARIAVSLLDRLVENQRVDATRIELHTKLVVRESTGPPAA